MLIVLVLVLICSLCLIGISSWRLTTVSNAKSNYSVMRADENEYLKKINGVFTFKDNINDNIKMNNDISNIIKNVLKNKGLDGLKTFSLKIGLWASSIVISIIGFFISLFMIIKTVHSKK
tara:strand:+ start:120 stop:479 length:360 start_codon:yes stop_codon:yes gene_type:complete